MYFKQKSTGGTSIHTQFDSMAPEMIDAADADLRADIYSLGIVLYQLLTGKVPFNSDSSIEIVHMHREDPLPDIKKKRPNTPDGLIKILKKMTEKKIRDRYRSAKYIYKDLRELAPELPD